MAEYTGLDMVRVQELNLLEYSTYFRDGVIHRRLQSEEGREYLKECWILEQTKPDRGGIRHIAEHSGSIEREEG